MSSKEEWTVYKLKDLCTKIGSGATPRGGKETYLAEGLYALIRSQNVLDFFFSYGGLAFIDESQANQLSNVEIQERDVLLNITGDSVARVCQVPNTLLPARVNQHVSIIRSDNTKLIPEYLKYFLLNPKFKSYLLGLASVGATRNALTKGMIEDFDINLPPLPTQRRIADILSALDEKIELNRQTNATLEAIAQSIFREWFVEFNLPDLSDPKGLLRDQASLQAKESGENGSRQAGQTFRVSGIPQGWRVGKLGDICKNIRNTVHPKDVDLETAYVGLEHIPRKSLGLTSWGVSSDVDSQKTRFKKYDILFGKLRPYFHKVCIAPLDGICSTDILVIEPLKSEFFSYYLNYLFSDELIAYVSLVADGTRMPRVDWNSISNYEIVIPPENLLAQFNEATFSLYEKIIENNQQTATLAAVRDALLPKLMSGEIGV